jgi:hypothetical protein
MAIPYCIYDTQANRALYSWTPATTHRPLPSTPSLSGG